MSLLPFSISSEGYFPVRNSGRDLHWLLCAYEMKVLSMRLTSRNACLTGSFRFGVHYFDLFTFCVCDDSAEVDLEASASIGVDPSF